MAVIQGSYVRKVPLDKTKKITVLGLWIIIPSFVFVGIAQSTIVLYIGLFLYALCKSNVKVVIKKLLFFFVTATALTVPCLMTMASQYGTAEQKGVVMGIFRSLGALARASGPIVASIMFWSIGSYMTYLIGAFFLLWPVLRLKYSYIENN